MWDVVVDKDVVQFVTVGAMKCPFRFCLPGRGAAILIGTSSMHFGWATRRRKRVRPTALAQSALSRYRDSIRVRSWAGRGRGCAGSSADEWTTAVEK